MRVFDKIGTFAKENLSNKVTYASGKTFGLYG